LISSIDSSGGEYLKLALLAHPQPSLTYLDVEQCSLGPNGASPSLSLSLSYTENILVSSPSLISSLFSGCRSLADLLDTSASRLKLQTLRIGLNHMGWFAHFACPVLLLFLVFAVTLCHFFLVSLLVRR
jgi:hypothetical protein